MKKLKKFMMKPKKVNFLANHDDFQVLLLGSMGFSTQFISDSTGLSYCQVTYRLGKGSIRRADYRDGKSEASQEMMSVAKLAVTKVVKRNL